MSIVSFPRQLPHAVEAERLQTHQVRARRTSDVGEQRPHRVRGVHLLLARDTDDQQRATVYPPQDEPQHVDGSLVGPLQVVDHEHGRCRAEIGEHGVEDVEGVFRVAEHPQGFLAHAVGDVANGSKRPRRGERIAHSRQCASPSRPLGQELLHECSLASPRFADDRLVAVAPDQQAAVTSRHGHHRRLDRQRTATGGEPGRVGADRLGQQFLGPLQVLVRGAAVVEPTAGEHVVTERLLPQHLEHAVVGAAPLPVPGRGESVPVALAVIDESVEEGRLGLVHGSRVPGQGLSTTLTMPSCFFWNVS